VIFRLLASQRWPSRVQCVGGRRHFGFVLRFPDACVIGRVSVWFIWQSNRHRVDIFSVRYFRHLSSYIL
jgi:hypothetical protein